MLDFLMNAKYSICRMNM